MREHVLFFIKSLCGPNDWSYWNRACDDKIGAWLRLSLMHNFLSLLNAWCGETLKKQENMQCELCDISALFFSVLSTFATFTAYLWTRCWTLRSVKILEKWHQLTAPATGVMRFNFHAAAKCLPILQKVYLSLLCSLTHQSSHINI